MHGELTTLVAITEKAVQTHCTAMDVEYQMVVKQQHKSHEGPEQQL